MSFHVLSKEKWKHNIQIASFLLEGLVLGLFQMWEVLHAVFVHDRLFSALLLINTPSLCTLTLFVTSQQPSQRAIRVLEAEDLRPCRLAWRGRGCKDGIHYLQCFFSVLINPCGEESGQWRLNWCRLKYCFQCLTGRESSPLSQLKNSRCNVAPYVLQLLYAIGAAILVAFYSTFVILCYSQIYFYWRTNKGSFPAYGLELKYENLLEKGIQIEDQRFRVFPKN